MQIRPNSITHFPQFDAYIKYRKYDSGGKFKAKYLYCFQDLLLLCNIIPGRDVGGEAFSIFLWVKIEW